MGVSWKYPYEPLKAQREAHGFLVDELLYGGAAGGGKTDFLLAECMTMALMVPGSKSLLLRRTFPEIEQEIEPRIRIRIPRDIGRYNTSKHVLNFYNGSQLRLGYIDTHNDMYRYVGAEYQLMCVERGTKVLMADKSWRSIETVEPGDMVETLQGPRAVTRRIHVGKRPSARITTPYGSVVASLNHPILTGDGWASPGELLSSRLHGAGASFAESLGQPPAGGMPQGSPLSGPRQAGAAGRLAPEDIRRRGTPGFPASPGSVGAGSYAQFQGAVPLGGWSGPVVLYGPNPHQAHAGAPALVHGADYGQGDSLAQGSTSGYPLWSHSGGGQAPGETVIFPDGTRRQADAAGHIHARWTRDGVGNTPAYNLLGKLAYDHPYTMEPVVALRDAHHGHADIRLVGEADLFDLSVEGAAHYVTQGNIIARNCWDELTTFVPAAYIFLKSRLRASGALRDRMKALGLRPRMLAATNPGNRSHGFVKARFVDPVPARTVMRDRKTLQTRVFIPAKLDDNPYLDESYRSQLQSLDETQRRALEDGDWDILEGVRFAEFRVEKHVVTPDVNPMDLVTYPRCVAVDYGYADPFVAQWMAKLPDGTILVYREVSMRNLTATQQAELIRDSEMEGERGPLRPLPLVMDPSMWRRNEGGGSSSAGDDAPPLGSPAYDYMKVLRVTPRKALNARVPGWAQISEIMREVDGRPPRLQIYDTCRDLIRTLPSLPRDDKNPDDVDTHADDHSADTLRYGVMFLLGKKKREQADRWRKPIGFEQTLAAEMAKADW